MAPRGTYRHIADELRQLIARGELPPGTLVPSELVLAERHQVARGTARSALAALMEEGLIEVVPGQGRRVVGDGPAVPVSTYERIAADLLLRINSGEFGPADPMPSEATLVADYGVSRNTVRRAYKRLAEAGAVIVRQGAGAYAAPR